MTKEKEMDLAREQLWLKMAALVDVYKTKVKQLEIPLFNIQKSTRLSSEKRQLFSDYYHKLTNYIHNLTVLEEEFKNASHLEVIEKTAVLDLSEKVISEILVFLEMLNKAIKE
jgi:hypothetical protein